MERNLYLIKQDVNTEFDTYDGAVVCADSEWLARRLHPSGNVLWKDGRWFSTNSDSDLTAAMYLDEWCEPKDVTVEKVGVAESYMDTGQIVCASFNAG